LKNDSIFTTHYLEINLPSTAAGSHINIQPVGDVHRFAPNCVVEKWKNFCQWAKKEDTPYTYYLLMGDMDDFASSSERQILTSEKLHESTKKFFDRHACKAIDELIGEIDFMKDRTIGCIQGNHYWEFESGESSTQYIAEALNSKWLGDVAYIRLKINFPKTHQSSMVDIVAAHGKAGGQLVGTSINQVEKLREIFPSADIYIMGHDHHKGAWPVSVLEVTNKSHLNNDLIVKQKRQWLARSGSFLAGYAEGEQSYVVKRLYRPTDIGIIRFKVDFFRQCKGGSDIMTKDIHVWN